jgi:4-hydroxybenzoyl-CoA reductase subunit beta
VKLPKFDYVQPKNLKEASSMLLDDPRATILAGGTDLLVNMKHRVEMPSLIVNIKGISDLDFIETKNGAIRIGALASLKKVYTNPRIGGKLHALGLAASSVGSYHHQSMGTIGGNVCQQNRCKYFNQSQWWRSSRAPCFKAGGEICHVLNKKGKCYSSYCGDVAPALLVLNAKVALESKTNKREISLDSLFSGDGKTPLNLERGEILSEIIVHDEATDGFSTYVKFANRESIDFPIVGIALWVSMEGKEVRVSFTGVDRRPVRARNVEDFLRGKELNEETLEQAVDLSSKVAKPVKTSLYSPSFKRKMLGRLLRSGLPEVVRRAAR